MVVKVIGSNLSEGWVWQSKAPSCLSLTTKTHAGKIKQWILNSFSVVLAEVTSFGIKTGKKINKCQCQCCHHHQQTLSVGECWCGLLQLRKVHLSSYLPNARYGEVAEPILEPHLPTSCVLCFPAYWYMDQGCWGRWVQVSNAQGIKLHSASLWGSFLQFSFILLMSKGQSLY